MPEYAPAPLDTSATVLVCIFSLMLNFGKANQKNSIMKGLKRRSRELLETIFVTKKKKKKADRLGMKFSSAPIFCCSLFFEEYLNPQVRSNKMVNEHTIYYHPSPSELTSRIHALIFLWTPKGFISKEYFLNFSETYISHHG